MKCDNGDVELACQRFQAAGDFRDLRHHIVGFGAGREELQIVDDNQVKLCSACNRRAVALICKILGLGVSSMKILASAKDPSAPWISWKSISSVISGTQAPQRHARFRRNDAVNHLIAAHFQRKYADGFFRG